MSCTCACGCLRACLRFCVYMGTGEDDQLKTVLLQDGMNALHFAVMADNVEAVTMLLEAGMDVNSKDKVRQDSFLRCLALRLKFHEKFLVVLVTKFSLVV